jgi:hypothetical protein
MKPIRIDACYGFRVINPEAVCKIETYKIPWYKSIWYSITYYAPYVLIFLIGFSGVCAILLLFAYIVSKL